MKRWPIIRHLRYLWLSFRLRSVAGKLPSVDELKHLNDIWEGRA